jgi:hypothetical protein
MDVFIYKQMLALVYGGAGEGHYFTSKLQVNF